MEYISLHRLHQLDILFGILTEHVAAGCVPQTGYLRKHPPLGLLLLGYWWDTKYDTAVDSVRPNASKARSEAVVR